MDLEFFRYGHLDAKGIVGRRNIERIFKANPTDKPLGLIPVKNLVSVLYVNERTTLNGDKLQPGKYPSSRPESGIFTVQSAARTIAIHPERGSRDYIRLVGSFLHLKPENYEYAILPYQKQDGDVNYDFAELNIDNYSAPGQLEVRITSEMGEEEY